MQCSGITQGGERCRLPAAAGLHFCWSHSPENADARRDRAKRAGKAGGNGRPASGQAAEVRELLSFACQQLRLPPEERVMERADCSVLAQVAGVRIRLIELERRIDEQENMMETLEELEQYAEAGRRGVPWAK